MLELSAQQKAAFLKKLKSTHGNVSKAAAAIKIGRTAAYSHKLKDADFAGAWDDVLASVYDEAEGELYRRAIVGWQEKKGGPKKKSDRLLEFFLKGNRAEKYRERFDVNQNVSGSLDLNIQATINQVYGDDDTPEAPESPDIDAGADQDS
jgi:hypothetical protein